MHLYIPQRDNHEMPLHFDVILRKVRSVYLECKLPSVPDIHSHHFTHSNLESQSPMMANLPAPVARSIWRTTGAIPRLTHHRQQIWTSRSIAAAAAATRLATYSSSTSKNSSTFGRRPTDQSTLFELPERTPKTNPTTLVPHKFSPRHRCSLIPPTNTITTHLNPFRSNYTMAANKEFALLCLENPLLGKISLSLQQKICIIPSQ